MDNSLKTEGRPGVVRTEIKRFWNWYERNYKLNITIALGLFVLQLFHLMWLALDVVAFRLTGTSLFPAHGLMLGILVLVDFFEIPALFSVSLVYINELRKKPNAKNIIFLVLLNSQWLHIMWITDNFVVKQFSGAAAWPMWLAWAAIGIDFLELPVMYDTAKRFLVTLKSGASLEEVKAAISEDAPSNGMTMHQMPNEVAPIAAEPTN